MLLGGCSDLFLQVGELPVHGFQINFLLRFRGAHIARDVEIEIMLLFDFFQAYAPGGEYGAVIKLLSDLAVMLVSINNFLDMLRQ